MYGTTTKLTLKLSMETARESMTSASMVSSSKSIRSIFSRICGMEGRGCGGREDGRREEGGRVEGRWREDGRRVEGKEDRIKHICTTVLCQ